MLGSNTDTLRKMRTTAATKTGWFGRFSDGNCRDCGVAVNDPNWARSGLCHYRIRVAVYTLLKKIAVPFFIVFLTHV